MTAPFSSLFSRLLRRLSSADSDRSGNPALLAVGMFAATVFTAAALLAKRRLLRLEIEGLSMVPVLAPGDRVLVLRTDRLTVGDIVALRDPDDAQAVLVKRVAGVDRSSIRVEGDSSATSRDSRHFGPVPRSDAIGRVLWCYRSAHRPAR